MNIENIKFKNQTHENILKSFRNNDYEDESVNSTSMDNNDYDNSSSYNKTSMLFSKYKTILHNITNRTNL